MIGEKWREMVLRYPGAGGTTWWWWWWYIYINIYIYIYNIYIIYIYGGLEVVLFKLALFWLCSGYLLGRNFQICRDSLSCLFNIVVGGYEIFISRLLDWFSYKTQMSPYVCRVFIHLPFIFYSVIDLRFVSFPVLSMMVDFLFQLKSWRLGREFTLTNDSFGLLLFNLK